MQLKETLIGAVIAGIGGGLAIFSSTITGPLLGLVGVVLVIHYGIE